MKPADRTDQYATKGLEIPNSCTILSNLFVFMQ